MDYIDISDIPKFKIGHAQNFKAATGCTVILCEEGAITGVDVRGGAPATRQTDSLNPVNHTEKVHAILLTGGSAFGLDAAGGVMNYLEERSIGFDVGVTKIPSVCSAALFDLKIGEFSVRPDKGMAYQACLNSNKKQALEGSIGAGTGATIGKILGMDSAMKSGVGISVLKIKKLIIGAIMVVNCLGDVREPNSGRIIGGVLNKDKNGLLSTEDIMISKYDNKKDLFSVNTTIGVVITNAKLTKAQANKIASISQDGIARTIMPPHSMYDGDTIFTMGCGNVKADISTVGFLSVRAVEEAIVRAVILAETLCECKGYRDIFI